MPARDQQVLLQHLADADPQLDEESYEFVDVDVLEVGVNVDLPILRIPLVAAGEAGVPEVLDGEAPHVIKVEGPAAQTVEGSISLSDHSGNALNNESNGSMPHVVVEVG